MNHDGVTYNLGLLEQSEAKWRRSVALRLAYAELFRDVATHLRPGRTLELGSGIGVAKEFIANLVTSDIQHTRFVDCAVSCYDIRPAAGELSNIVAIDVLHHLRRPLDFLASAANALNPGGRLVLLEPAGTSMGRLFYRAFHHEPCEPGKIEPPFEFAGEGEFANMGMAMGLFVRHRVEIERKLQTFGMRVAGVHYRDVVAYSASGGFSRPALLPAAMIAALFKAERCIPQALLRHMALRMIVVCEKTA